MGNARREQAEVAMRLGSRRDALPLRPKRCRQRAEVELRLPVTPYRGDVRLLRLIRCFRNGHPQTNPSSPSGPNEKRAVVINGAPLGQGCLRHATGTAVGFQPHPRW